MPIYEYECPKCGRFEAVQKVSEKPLKADPDCKRSDCPRKAKRLVSAAAFHLKGSGWYKTDYASGKSTAPAAAATAAATVADSSSDDSSEGGKKKKKGEATAKKPSSCGSGCGCH